MYREHYGLVWGAARRFGVADRHLDDAVQDAFVVAYRHLGSFDGKSPRAWLYSIARRVASNYRRAERRATRRKDAVHSVALAVRPRTTQAAEAWQAIDRFVAGLGERQQAIFILSELEGMTGAEVARSLGLRPSTTYDAIRDLRRRFIEDVVDAPPDLERMARRDRPRATTRRWAALVAALPSGRIAGTTGGSTLATWTSLSTGVKTVLASVAAATALAGGLVLAADGANARTEPEAPGRVEPSEAAPSPPTLTQQPTELASAAPVTPEATPSPRPPAEPTTTRTIEPPRPRKKNEPAAPGLAVENAILRDGAAALASGDASRALALANEHARKFPRSSLGDLRTALRIESLCALGKTAQARGETRLFLERRPASPLAQRLEAACPEQKRESAP